MVRLIPEVAANDHFGSMRLAMALFISVTALVAALCAKAKHGRRAPQQINETNCKEITDGSKKLVASISNKAIPFVHKNKGGRENCSQGDEVEDGFGEGGVWQRSILMGDKCQPPEFSGAIYYDSSGNQLSERPPRSPRVASPLAMPSFLSPVARDAN
ncbi:hypothetical protein L3X38_005943 [Prunus dulcis]|uniref:Uncharacterized protein n=1 Tax=Prunus dulcis TaxID=3755 RepID=A0AAD4ZRU6_PRUDU|nr:hypothetical protein L3X38_005943 [Prunus dulcis]